MSDKFTDPMKSQTRRRMLQTISCLGAVTIGGVSSGAATTNTDIEFSSSGGGATSTADDKLMTSAHMEVTFSDEVSFGPQEDRGFRITNVDTGATLRATAAEPFTVAADERVRFSHLYNQNGTIDDGSEVIYWVGDGSEIDVEVEGDTDIFTDGPIFSTYTIELIENLNNPTPVASTNQAAHAIGLERPAIEQDGTSGEITLTLELPEALDPSWFVEFDSTYSDDGLEFEPTMVPNDGTDKLEWTVDFSGSEQGNYHGWRLAIGPTEDVSSGNYIWYTSGGDSTWWIDGDTISIGNGDDEPDEIDFEDEAFSEEQYNAVFPDDESQTALSNAINEWFQSPTNEVNGVEIDQTTLSELINFWFQV